MIFAASPPLTSRTIAMITPATQRRDAGGSENITTPRMTSAATTPVKRTGLPAVAVFNAKVASCERRYSCFAFWLELDRFHCRRTGTAVTGLRGSRSICDQTYRQPEVTLEVRGRDDTELHFAQHVDTASVFTGKARRRKVVLIVDET